MENFTISPSASPIVTGWQGYVSLVVAVVLFGTNYIPVKKVNPGDGVFYQFIMCTAIFITGVVLGTIQNFPEIYPTALLGGVIWATGNMLVVPIVHTIGLGLGLMLWSSCSLVVGWAGGRFGFFGLNQQIPEYEVMNYCGVALALFSTCLFTFVKPNLSTDEDSLDDDSTARRLGTINNSSSADLVREMEQDADLLQEQQPKEEPSEVIEKLHSLPATARRIIGVTLALIAGVLYGFQFTPIVFIQDHPEIFPSASNKVLDHIMTMYLGIFITSFVYFLAYCLLMRRKIWLNKSLILPGMLSGVMWAIGEAGFILGTQYLSEAVAFPITASIPSLISGALGVFLFKEIRGARNIIILGVAAVVAVSAAVVTGFSKG